jgi:hypothetical protein
VLCRYLQHNGRNAAICCKLQPMPVIGLLTIAPAAVP